MSESAALPESQTSEPSAAVGLVLGTALCALAVVPAALRAGASFMAWLMLLGAAAFPVGLFAASLRGIGMSSRGVRTVLFALALSSAPLTVLARVLKATTHHRPLGGVTFAIIAIIVLLGATAVAARLLSWGGDGMRKRIVLAIAVLAALVGLRFVMAAVGGQAGFIRSAVLDGALLAAAGFAAGSVPASGALAARARRLGTIVWALVVGLGLSLCFAMPREAAAAKAAAPVTFAAFSPFVR